MLKNDYVDLWQSNNIKKMTRGDFNMWLSDPDEKFGFKIFFSDSGGPKYFLNYSQNTFVSDIPLLSDEKLKDMFQLLQELHELGYTPEPLEIVIHKSVKCIKMRQARVLSEDDGLFLNKEQNIDFKTEFGLKSIFIEDYVNILSNNPCFNYGEINDRLVLIDVDADSLTNWVKRI